MMEAKPRSTILWLTGWSMPEMVFDRLRHFLPDFQHASINYSEVSSIEEILHLTETAAKNAMSVSSGSLLLGGWSLGGILALRLAVMGLADGLILFSTTARFTRPNEQMNLGWSDTHVRRMIAGIVKDRQAAEMRFRQMVFAEVEPTDIPPKGNWTTAALVAGLEVLRSVDCLSRLPEINKPALLVHGTNDMICPYAAAEELLALLPSAELLTVPNSGHVPFMGREANLAETVRGWWHGQQKSGD